MSGSPAYAQNRLYRTGSTLLVDRHGDEIAACRVLRSNASLLASTGLIQAQLAEGVQMVFDKLFGPPLAVPTDVNQPSTNFECRLRAEFKFPKIFLLALAIVVCTGIPQRAVAQATGVYPIPAFSPAFPFTITTNSSGSYTANCGGIPSFNTTTTASVFPPKPFFVQNSFGAFFPDIADLLASFPTLFNIVNGQSGSSGQSISRSAAPPENVVYTASVSGHVLSEMITQSTTFSSTSNPGTSTNSTTWQSTYDLATGIQTLSYVANGSGTADIFIIINPPPLPPSYCLESSTASAVGSATFNWLTHTIVSGGSTPLTVTTILPSGQPSAAYPPQGKTAQLVSGGIPPYAISATGLPPGLTVDSNGAVTGIPLAGDSGVYSVTVSVTDSAGSVAGPATVPITITTGYNISISGLATTQPGTALPLTAIVTDSSGNPVSGASVHLKLSVVAHSGGHIHDDDTDPGRTGAVGGSQDYPVPTPTDAQGAVSFTFAAPMPAGIVNIAASCDDRSCTQTGQSSVDVKIPNLISLSGASSNYILVGETASHPDNHYLNPQALTKAQELAAAWHSALPWVPVLAYNDASLVWGGRFDLDQDWIPPHAEHTAGVVIDVRANGTPTAIPAGYGLIFALMVYNIGGNVHPEADHFHVRLLGAAK